MIDIHNHVIFDFDDGPKSIEESIAMLRIAMEQGITDVFATSHINELVTPEQETSYFKRFAALEEELESRDIPIRLHSGCEMFHHHFMDKTVRKTRVGTLCNQGKYVLMEFPLYLMPSGVEETLFKLTMDNLRPIIAHPERYSALHDKQEKILQFIRYGGLLQVNTGSILGDFGKTVKRIAMWLIENRYVHFLGSDAHKPEGRTFKMRQAVQYLSTYIDDDYIEALTLNNARSVIENEDISPMTLPERLPQKKQGLLQQVSSRFKRLIP
ncbi:MAG: hypothetical protein KDI06_07050 [Calditrichaeota bacterium]|nr:hypothetical protein [Calditrichota bacterium]